MDYTPKKSASFARKCPFRTFLQAALSPPCFRLFLILLRVFSFFAILPCVFVAACDGRPRRKMVASSTLQRYPETFDLAASAVNAALRGATVEGVDLFAEVTWARVHTECRGCFHEEYVLRTGADRNA